MSYSPDGSRLVGSLCFQNCGNGRGPDLYLLDSRNGQILQQLTNTGNNGVTNSSPKWSPRGDWIVFTESIGEQQGLRLISPTANPTVRQIDTGNMASYGPSWSNDGKDIAFVGVSNGNHDIWLAGAVTGPEAETSKAEAVSTTPDVKPSFNCEYAKTPSEKLICADAQLAVLENNMVVAYNRAVRVFPADQSAVFRREHLEWFKGYARACNAAIDDEQRKKCVSDYLSTRIQQIESQLRR